MDRNRHAGLINDGADDDGTGHTDEADLAQKADTDDDGSQGDDHGAGAHRDVGITLLLRIEAAAHCAETIGDDEAGDLDDALVKAEGGHQTVVAADSPQDHARLRPQVPVEDEFDDQRDDQKDDRRLPRIERPAEDRVHKFVIENGVVAVERNVGLAHETQVHGIERGHHDDAGQKVADAELHVDEAGDKARQTAGQKGNR